MLHCWIIILALVVGGVGIEVCAAEKPAAKNAAAVSADHAQKMQAGVELFKAHVRPLLVAHCLDCHGGKSTKADFDLSSREVLMASGMVEAAATSSQLYRVVAHLDEPHMPHKAPKLSDAAIANLGRWIELGAPYDKPLLEKAGGLDKSKELIVSDEDRRYWAFRPLAQQTPPQVKDAAWPRSDIDRFLLVKMESHGVKPVADADPRMLIRRAYFDTIGLPPTVEEVEKFVSQYESSKKGEGKSGRPGEGAKAYEAVLDKLLKSPRFGERWARHWLDPARFAESHGFEHDYDRPHAYWYRDFVIRAFNDDMPYDQFVRWQIAGDELAPNDPWAQAATGFLGAGVFPTQITTREAERIRYDAMDDMLSTTGHAILGLTVGCARCHDHKYDPIPTRDYYQLLSAFTTTVRSEIDWDFGTDAEKQAMREFEARLKPHVDRRAEYEKKTIPERVAKWAEDHKGNAEALGKVADPNLRATLEQLADGKITFAKLDRKRQDALVAWHKPQDAEWKQLDMAVVTLERERPKETRTKIQICTEGLKPMRHHTAIGAIPDFYPETYLLNRGDTAQKGDVASLSFLQVLMKGEPSGKPWIVAKPESARTSMRRSSLANWLVDTHGGAGELTARVIVNRLWHHHFGRGIVSTINDFGIQGELPSHPELLDWLAADFIANGWKLKRLHKQILMSRVYRLSGNTTPENLKADVNNQWWWHRPRRRLEAEAIRDHLLAVSGELDTKMYGPGTLDEGMKRRSIYFMVKRSRLIPSLQVFDWPDTLTSAAARPTTVVAPQALLLMNNPHVQSWAGSFGKRLKPAAERSLSAAVDEAFRIAFSRPPQSTEVSEGVAFLTARKSTAGGLDRALQDYALVLMSLNEFIYVD